MEHKEERKKRANEYIVNGMFMGFIVVVYFFELIVIIPKLNETNSSFHPYVHIFCGTCILFNIFLAIYKFVKTDPTSGGKILPATLQEGWYFCWKCEANSPPRSRHCFFCNKCILVRDHHCVLVSQCVGHATLRYFISMMFYIWCALLYANILHFDFVLEEFHSWSYKSMLTMFLPWLSWLLGITRTESIVIAIISSLSLLGLMYCTTMLIIHGRNLVKNRTQYEYVKKIGLKYDHGLSENLRQTFGENWKIAWLCPLIPSMLPGDGINFAENPDAFPAHPQEVRQL